ncbi:MAG: hypothetical protein BMS9Abin12_2108 [Acidimicrobiia bacterium]|nr:MAG: hypothetical protein BMS9Abin12_2108 [Acidimicrobiia bacterium]
MGLTPVEVALHGGTQSLESPRLIEGDHFTAGLETPSLRNVAIDGLEVAQSITFSVRDKNWGTAEPSDWSTSFKETNGSIDVAMEGRFTSDEMDLRASITVRTAHDGSLTYAAKAIALRDFERARIGICVMHPANFTGQQLHVSTPDEAYSTVFPVNVSPSRAISNIVTLRHSIGDDREVLFEFEGDLFEFEDQRNWSDASYKTFCTPLSLPWPVAVRSGDIIEQRLRISTVGNSTFPSTIAPRPRTGATAVHIDLDAEGRPVPSIGVLCDIDPATVRAASALGVPHLRLSLDTRSESAATELAAAGQALAGSDTGIELELVADSPGDLLPLHQNIAHLGDRLQRVFVFDRETQITTKAYGPAIDDLRSATGSRVGGGSGSNFGAINFNLDDIAFDSLDALTFPISPQVHYTDHFSFIANLDAQAVLAANGRRLAGHRQLSIGPVTLLPRQAGKPLAPDPRSASLLASAWTVASLSELMSSGADALTYHQMGGPAGIVTHDGAMNPTYHLLADLARYRSARYLPVHIDSPERRVAAIALRGQSDALIVIASLESEPVDIELPLPSTNVTIRTLDQTTYDIARSGQSGFTDTTTPWNGDSVQLLPFAVATLHVTF